MGLFEVAAVGVLQGRLEDSEGGFPVVSGDLADGTEAGEFQGRDLGAARAKALVVEDLVAIVRRHVDEIAVDEAEEHLRERAFGHGVAHGEHAALGGPEHDMAGGVLAEREGASGLVAE